jgi:hypothetical protein
MCNDCNLGDDCDFWDEPEEAGLYEPDEEEINGDD